MPSRTKKKNISELLKARNINSKKIPKISTKGRNKKVLELAFKKLIETENVLLFFVTIFKINKSNKKKTMVILKKFRDADFIIPKSYKNKDLVDFYTTLNKNMPSMMEELENNSSPNSSLLKMINNTPKNKKKQKGSGAYLDRLVKKGDQPITGQDVERTLDEIGEFLQALRYTPLGNGATGFQVLFDLLRGNDDAMKFYLKFNIMPKYFTPIPPTINMENIRKELPSIGEYLSLYTTHRRITREAKREAGELTPEDLKPDFFDKLAKKAQNIRGKMMQVQMLRNPAMAVMM